MLQSFVENFGIPMSLAWRGTEYRELRPTARLTEHGCCTEFEQFMAHARLMMDRNLPVGMAVVIGEADVCLCRELKDQLCRTGECIIWGCWGPVVAVIFRRNLVRELAPVMREVFSRYPDLRVGAALSELLADHHDLWLAARLALETAMGHHENLVVLDGAEASQSVTEYRMATAMRRDLHNGSNAFEAYFQPQVALDTFHPTGAEALARWTWDGERVPPSVFVPVAEKFGLISALGETMLGQTASTLARLRHDGIQVPKIAVNVSPDQMARGDFLRTALNLIWEEGLEPEDIELEITESLAGEGGSDFRNWLAELAEAGFHLAIDDFGTGTSTLARIREIPVAKLKLDRAFVLPLPEDESGRRICELAVHLAGSLGMHSLAEGVETPAQAIYLRNAGCELGQGYLWGRPMPADDLAGWWRQQSAIC